MSTDGFERLEDLSDRLLAGDVVFFVGAGFSLDSEGNSGWRMVSRLLARFLGMHGVLAKRGVLLRDADRVREGMEELYKGLIRTFGLKDKNAAKGTDWFKEARYIEVLKALTQGTNYYLINDWTCSAFGEIVGFLAGEGVTPNANRRIIEDINRAENDWLKDLNPSDEVALPEIRVEGLHGLEPAERGKALFLDTQGFLDEEIMAGDPDLPAAEGVAKSFGNRLLRRHHALARLAREGLCPMLVTTNFDLLVEGAYRLSGFLRRDKAHPDEDDLPPTRHPDYARVTNAAQFYYGRNRACARPSGRGGQQTATIVKIHGCADTYRRSRHAGPEELRAVLPSLVFTFREVQNWREDSWSRDLLHTLLRTRTIVFCGYSTADPVLHDTLRTVYEEMAERGRRFAAPVTTSTAALPALPDAGVDPRTAAPAFFFGLRESGEFHALEVLRAASRAVGASNPALTRHPNYVEFLLRSDAQRGFPQLDELMAWVFHRVYRKRQAQALHADLRGIATLVLNKPPRQSEVETVLRNFERIRDQECGAARGWFTGAADDSPDNDRRHRTCERVTAWTEHFHPHLLRELALADLVLRRGGPNAGLGDLRSKPWYYPAGENYGWTAWGVVVEVALRRMAAAFAKAPQAWSDPEPWSNPSPRLEPTACVLPSVALSPGEGKPAPLCLTIGFEGFGRAARPVPVEGLYRHRVFWNLLMQELPWTPADQRTPSAAVLWRWASLPHDATEPPAGDDGKPLGHFFEDAA
ncbi:SIR2 family protein [Azospirillum soli]|uniref:SIR2 family protein n=1 Tax=Azospirillum soli TaxID=1304799 RepID=UPI001AE4CEAE|nr:SIR2 family protein [Azospirillum soli]MBP2315330.1 hypothetical protein [Azospirillum soli]